MCPGRYKTTIFTCYFFWGDYRESVTSYLVCSCYMCTTQPKYSRPRLGDKHSLRSSCIPPPSFDSRYLPPKIQLPNASRCAHYFWGTIGNRTRIEGSTNLSVNRYTIVPMTFLASLKAISLL